VADHQSQLPPSENKFHSGNGDDGKHYWITPPEVKDPLQDEFRFDFDPCPYPLPEGFDGLTCEWGKSNYVNPPFGSIIHQGRKKGPTFWARKALEQQAKGRGTVLVYPIDKWVLMLLGAGAEVRNLGDVRWLSIEDGKPGKGTGRHIAAFILRAKPQEQLERWKMEKARICQQLGLAPKVCLGEMLTEIERLQRIVSATYGDHSTL
jgi:hypothetical protein